MKRRASLLFGLGVLVSLSMSVPTYAATDNTQSIPQTQEAQQNEEGTEISSYKISEKTADGRGGDWSRKVIFCYSPDIWAKYGNRFGNGGRGDGKDKTFFVSVGR